MKNVVQIIFTAVLAEPELCRELRWFNMNELPENCTPITYSVLKPEFR
ncbi:hypothetical protein [Vibrio salinus]|nr:hypothetical protein [Vibrio salinus]MCE0495453.1 hypothetical protein [Vibrio salinus]